MHEIKQQGTIRQLQQLVNPMKLFLAFNKEEENHFE